MVRSIHPVVRMRSVVCAFLNGPSCVYVEPVKRSTYVVPERNGKFLWAPTVCPHCGTLHGYL